MNQPFVFLMGTLLGAGVMGATIMLAQRQTECGPVSAARTERQDHSNAAVGAAGALHDAWLAREARKREQEAKADR